MLELSHVTFRYAEGLPDVLKDISLSFDKGEFVAITGRNGCGKTTVTRLLTGQEKAASGQILYHGKDVTREEPSERSRFIGYVFQQPDRQMFMPTVREEIAFGPYQQGKRGAELEEAVARAMQDTDTEALGRSIRASCLAATSSESPLPRHLQWIPNISCSMNRRADRTDEKNSA